MAPVRYEEHAPPPGLARFVRCLWTLSSDGGAPPGEDRVLPDGCAEIVLHHGAAFERRSQSDRSPTTQHRHAVVGQIETALPLLLGGGTKILYDVLLWRAFRRLPPPEERRTEAPPAG